MEKLLFALAFFACFQANAQHDYISSSGTVILESGSIERYSSPNIYVTVSTQIRSGDVYWIATLALYKPASDLLLKTFQMEFDEATLDALTPTGSTTTEKTKNVLLQAVEVNLIAATGSDIFTLN